MANDTHQERLEALRQEFRSVLFKDPELQAGARIPASELREILTDLGASKLSDLSVSQWPAARAWLQRRATELGVEYPAKAA